MKDSINFSAKKMGIVLLSIAAALALLFLSAGQKILNSEDIECGKVCGIDMNTSAENCPHKSDLPIQSYAGFSISFVIGGIGAYLILAGRGREAESSEEEKKAEKIAGALGEDEKKIYGLLKAGGGAVFQSELMDKSGFTKVKVSRVLDRLEGRGVVERRRRGMTNMVIMRRP